MRAINAAKVIAELRGQGAMSRASLVRATGLSKPTITNVVAYLEMEGVLEAVAPLAVLGEQPTAASTRARPYRYRASRGCVLGIDLGADKILLVLADLDGSILGQHRHSTRDIRPLDPPSIFAAIGSSAARLLASASAGTRDLLSVVVGTPGVVSADGVVTLAPQLPGWEGLNLRQELEKLFECPVQIEREVALSLQAERATGVAAGVDDALFVQFGIGVAAGLLIDGRIYRGADGGAGEIGMMPLPPGVVSSATSQLGPFESEAGGIAFQRRGRELAATAAGMPLLARADGDPENIDAALVFAAARADDAAAAALVDDIVDFMAWGIGVMVCALNPRTVIIGGGLSRSADLFLPRLRARVDAVAPFAPRWLVSGFGEDAVALGAVHHATDLVASTLFSAGRDRSPQRGIQ